MKKILWSLCLFFVSAILLKAKNVNFNNLEVINDIKKSNPNHKLIYAQINKCCLAVFHNSADNNLILIGDFSYPYKAQILQNNQLVNLEKIYKPLLYSADKEKLLYQNIGATIQLNLDDDFNISFVHYDATDSNYYKYHILLTWGKSASVTKKIFTDQNKKRTTPMAKPQSTMQKGT